MYDIIVKRITIRVSLIESIRVNVAYTILVTYEKLFWLIRKKLHAPRSSSSIFGTDSAPD